MKLKVLVGTAYYKNEDITRDWIKNIKEQVLRTDQLEIDLSIIVVNGGSEKIKADGFKRVDLSENLGFSGNFNYVFREFLKKDYDYMVIMNNDAYFNDTGGLLTLVSNSVSFNSSNPFTIVSPTPNTIKNYSALKMSKHGYYSQYVMFPAVCWCMSKATVEVVGFLDEQFEVGCYEDDDYCKRLTDVKGWVIVTNLVGITHLGSQTMQLFNHQKAMSENAERFRKKWMKK